MPEKQRCRVCREDFVKWMVVEKKTMNIWRLFFCCSSNCGYFKWSNVSPKKKTVMYEDQSSGTYVESESSGVSLAKSEAKDDIEDLSRIFKFLARIFEEEYIEISLNITIHKKKGNAEDNGKEKGMHAFNLVS
ncbi:uncharacterized protein Fot_20021 [Forsythia ovata]|uniref:Uncharacterized protein n=1 Tax=Forsythia ovata TaxID=205694 RepID=A0ABD1VMQ3_9LAMI